MSCVPISPGICAVDAGNFVPTVAGFIGAQCEFWRGAMEYPLHFMCGQLHSGAVLVFWSKTAYTEGVTMGTDPTLISHSCVIDISSDITKIIRVDWNNNRPLGRMRLNNPINTIDASEINGFLVIAVASPLRGPTVPTNINYSVCMRAASDMIIGGLRVTTSEVSGSPIENSMRLEATLGDEQPSEICYLTGVRPHPNALVETFLGEAIYSIREMAQKFCRIGILALSVTNATIRRQIYVAIPAIPNAAGGNATAGHWGASSATVYEGVSVDGAGAVTTTVAAYNGIPQNMIGWLRSAFVGVRGGMLYKLVQIPTDSLTDSILVSSIQAVGYNGPIQTGIYSSSGNLRYNFPVATYPLPAVPDGKLANAGEFYIPYSSHRRYQSGFLYYGSGDTCRRAMFIFDVKTGSQTPGIANFGVFAAGAADISFIRFRHVPKITGSSPI